MTDVSSNTAGIDRATAEDLLYVEAARLDDRDLRGWLELFTDDAVYWLPMSVEDPVAEPSLVYDDRTRMEERVFRLLDTQAHAQMPPSRTQHDVANVRVRSLAQGSAIVTSHLVVHEVRVGDRSQVGLGVPRMLAGRCEHELRLVEGRWLIARKVVRLLVRDLPLYNLTFIV